MIMNDKYLIKFLYCGRYRPNIYKILTNEISQDIKSGNIAYNINKPYNYVFYIILTNEINKFKKENPNKAKEIEELFKNLKEVQLMDIEVELYKICESLDELSKRLQDQRTELDYTSKYFRNNRKYSFK